MLALLAFSVAVTTVSAQYGAANNPSAAQPSYSSNTIYYPPAIYDSHYWDYGSRERHHKQCPKLTTYVGEFPGIPDEAFYPPVIRYVKKGKKVTALVVCDRNVLNFNGLFGRRNSSRDIRTAYFFALGTTAGATFTCNRDERRFEGSAVDMSDTPPSGDYSKTVEITQLTCVGLDKTAIGLEAEREIQNVIGVITSQLVPVLSVAGRKKREASDGATETTDVANSETTVDPATEQPEVAAETTETIVENTDAPGTSASETATEEVANNTDSPVQVTEGTPTEQATPAPGSIEAVKASLEKLAEVLGKIF